jgi:nitrate/nitrite-specific signal transduction histidine kinase
MLQYERLEQKVAERTQELEISKVRLSILLRIPCLQRFFTV